MSILLSLPQHVLEAHIFPLLDLRLTRLVCRELRDRAPVACIRATLLRQGVTAGSSTQVQAERMSEDFLQRPSYQCQSLLQFVRAQRGRVSGVTLICSSEASDPAAVHGTEQLLPLLLAPTAMSLVTLQVSFRVCPELDELHSIGRCQRPAACRPFASTS